MGFLYCRFSSLQVPTVMAITYVLAVFQRVLFFFRFLKFSSAHFLVYTSLVFFFLFFFFFFFFFLFVLFCFVCCCGLSFLLFFFFFFFFCVFFFFFFFVFFFLVLCGVPVSKNLYHPIIVDYPHLFSIVAFFPSASPNALSWEPHNDL